MAQSEIKIDLSEALEPVRDALTSIIVLSEVQAEISSAREQHGKQYNLPLGFGNPTGSLTTCLSVLTASGQLDGLPNTALEFYSKEVCERDPEWAHIVFEEFAEALAAPTIEETRAELVQLAAMAVCSIIALDVQQAEA